ncbi:hypothetical protein GMRT_13489 [Giardia muris]|uniref:Uncharacterized protein n=1 Tax=Giardia muris TaxID=5742 RepID=A0A4Z1SWU9_GIAMU|nr:hypothetical protein GMRT_13489 [Giardia muris]|eukprot:TNJ27998.1 hypothetical protein GMRT_13489 [Giardia muris]
MGTLTSTRRPALLIPFFLPWGMSCENPTRGFVEALTRAICDAVFPRKHSYPGMHVELGVISASGGDKKAIPIMQSVLKKQAGLLKNVHVVEYPFKDESLKPLTMIHSLPLCIAVPLNLTSMEVKVSTKISVCEYIRQVPSVFLKLYADLLQTKFYTDSEQPKGVHPVMNLQRQNLEACLEGVCKEGKQLCIGTEDPLKEAVAKGGHRDARCFALPFTWILNKKKRTLDELKGDLKDCMEVIIERYLSLYDESEASRA